MKRISKKCWVATVSAPFMCLWLAAASHAQDRPPKQEDAVLTSAERAQVIATLTKEVGERYVFPDMAEKIALTFREREKRGEYNAITSAQKFAATLSEQLYETSKDRHMGVRYSARPIPLQASAGVPTAAEKAQELAEMKRRNFGIERVAVLPGNIGYLNLRNFVSAREAGSAVAAAMTLVQHTDAMIVDLRMNGGGEPTGVATMASYFLDDRTHINDYYDRKTGATEQSWTLDHLAGPRYGASRPLYILTSARTFSAAEEFAYDMKVLKRAVIIGEPTGGGAHPGDVYRLSEHFKMFIPTGRSINPVTKTDWDRVGVTPDVSISQEKALDAAQVAILKILIDASQDAGNKASLKQKLQLLESGNADKGPVHQ
jgi:hypothetical protein